MMTEEEIVQKREQAIESLANLMRSTPFTVEFKVKKNPKGIKIIYEVTQEHMDEMLQNVRKAETAQEKE